MSETNSTESNQPVLFSPHILRTENIPEELVRFARAKKIDSADITLEVLNCTLNIRRAVDGEEEEDWEEIDVEALEDKVFEKYLLSPEIEMKQVYEVKLKPHIENADFLLHTAIKANKRLSKVLVVVKKSSVIKYSRDLFDKIYNELNIRKLKAGLFIHFTDEDMKNDIRDLIIEIRDKGKLSKDVDVTLCKCIDITPPIDDKVIYHYKAKNSSRNKDGKVDHKTRGFLDSVKEDDTIIEYIKSKEGKPGRSCRGYFLMVPSAEEKNKINFSFSDGIREEESEDSIKYIANKSGYIENKDNDYNISSDLEITEINFKTTGSIKAGIDSGVKIKIQEKDPLKDSIAGVTVEAEEINIDGSVGAKSEIRAKTVKVGGMTHKTSTIEAESIDINVHKGYVKGKTVIITRLENGIVDAEVVKISQMMGGEVKAKEIYIDSFVSHCNLVASELIEIKEMSGSENKLTIDSMATSSNDVVQIKENLITLKEDKKKLESKIADEKTSIKKNKHIFDDLKAKIIDCKKRNTKPPSAFVKRYKEFYLIIEDCKKLEATLTEMIENEKIYKEKLNIIQSAILKAKIINKDKWKGHNEIKFKMVNSSDEIIYIPKGNEKVLSLKNLNESTPLAEPRYEIVAEK